jgi:F0F1-type ATP synthase membrane subunit c/vacuolar-type H+-ATPase subunit K
LLAGATVRPDAAVRPYRATIGVLAILIVAIGVGLIYAMAARASARAPSASVAPARPLILGHPVSPSTIK